MKDEQVEQKQQKITFWRLHSKRRKAKANDYWSCQAQTRKVTQTGATELIVKEKIGKSTWKA